jgi:outer membrane protein assembly factor BamB
MKKIPLLLLVILFLACQKEDYKLPRTPEEPAPESKAKVLWQYPLHKDTIEFFAEPHMVINDRIIFATHYMNPSSRLTAFNPEGGDPQWVYDGFEDPIAFLELYRIDHVDDRIFVADWDYVYAIDGNSGTLNWYEQVSGPDISSEIRVSAFGDYVYSSRVTGTVPTHNSSTLVRIHNTTKQVDTLFSIAPSGDGYYDNIKPPAFWINPAGDTVLIWNNSEPFITGGTIPIPPGMHNVESHLTAWNLRTRQVEWQINNYAIHGISSTRPPTIDGNFAYHIGKGELYCIDLLEGKIKWTRELSQFLSKTEPLIYNNLVIVKANGVGMWGLDKTNGAIIWKNSEADGQANRLDYCDDVVYFTGQGTGLLYAINAVTGATEWKERTPSRKKIGDATWGDGNVVIDRERKILYTADRFFFMAIDISK